MVSASRIEDTQVVKGVAVHIKNAKKYHFIEQNEIMDLAINKRNVDIAHTPFSKLDINSMEQVIKADPWVADAQVYVDNDRMLHIYITQRVPVARLFKQDGSSCYIDSALNIMPLSASYTYYTMVVTNVPGKDIVNGLGARRKIVALATAIHADSFWNAQVSGVALDSVGMFELTPVLGEHKILFGDTARMQEKLGNLLAFYKNVLNRIGWDKYEVLDVRYRNQVIASPSLPYKGPVDKAIESMNWISSIEETEAKKREKDSVDDVEQRYQAALQAAHHKTVPRHVKPVAAQPMVAKKQDKPVAKAAIKPAAKAVVKKTAAKPIPKAAKKKAVAKHADKKQKAVNKGNKKQEKGKQVPKYEYGAPKQRK
jgi:cell division protein FtsQ